MPAHQLPRSFFCCQSHLALLPQLCSPAPPPLPAILTTLLSQRPSPGAGTPAQRPSRVHSPHHGPIHLFKALSSNKQQKTGKGSEERFLQRQHAGKYMKRCSTSSALRETLIKTTERPHCTPTGTDIIKTENTSVGEGVEKLEPSCTAAETVKWCSHCGKETSSSAKG